VAIKYSKTNLKKIEEIFISNDFSVRYEKGHFKSGYCLLRDKKIIIINRFFKEKGRIESLLDILQETKIDKTKLSETSLTMLKNIEKYNLSEQSAA